MLTAAVAEPASTVSVFFVMPNVDARNTTARSRAPYADVRGLFRRSGDVERIFERGDAGDTAAMPAIPMARDPARVFKNSPEGIASD
jgi:hypothetical protein